MLPKFLTKQKIALLLLFFFLFSALFSKPIQAFYTPTTTYPFQFEQAVYKTQEMNLQSFVFEAFKATGASIIFAITGSMSTEEKEGLLSDAGRLTAAIYTSPPASGVQYFADIGKQLGIVTPAYAQEGVGFAIMRPLLPVWRAFRNLSYLFFVLILVGLGFAIMFRVKISPQAVITIQSALPKIVLALILITFSYAIVGFLFDLLVVFYFLIVKMFGGILVDGVIEVLDIPGDQAFRAALEALWGIIAPVIPNNVELIMTTLGSAILYSFGTQVATFFILMTLGPLGLLLGIILAILLLIIVVRILWTLLKAYAMIIVNLIFAPLIILVGTLPGSGAIGGWFRSLLANIAVLPTILAMLYIAQYLLIMGVLIYIKEKAFPLLIIFINAITGMGGQTLWDFIQQLLGLVTPISIMETLNMMLLPIIGFVILLLAPNAANMIQSFIRGRPFEYGAAITAPVGAAISVVTAPVRAIVSPITGEAAKVWGEEAGRKIPGIRKVYEWGARRGERTGERG